jgi:putative hydrolase of the HAD superfamily
MKNPSAVLFDVDGTLYDFGMLRFFLAVHIFLAGIRHPRRTLKEARILMHYRRALEWMRHHPSAGVHADSQIERVASVTGIAPQEIRATVDRWIVRAPLQFMHFCARKKLIKMIKRWHENGIPMGVYSDYPAEEKLRRLGILQCMTAVLCSSDREVGTFKPDPRGLQVLAWKLAQAPESCVYLGDREAIDVCAARRAGMRGLLFSNKNLVWLDAELGKACGRGVSGT